MQERSVPEAKFRRLEKVLVKSEGNPRPVGTIIWSEYTRFSQYYHGIPNPPKRWGEWLYCVCVDDTGNCYSLLESKLESMGEFDLEANHLGKRCEISFDTVAEEDSESMEGCYRLTGRFWEVFYFAKTDSTPHEPIKITWPSGLPGIEFEVPRTAILNREYIIHALSQVFSVESWTIVSGPDSLLLK